MRPTPNPNPNWQGGSGDEAADQEQAMEVGVHGTLYGHPEYSALLALLAHPAHPAHGALILATTLIAPAP